MFNRQGDKQWEKFGNLDTKLPPAAKAICDFCVEYKRDNLSLTILKRAPRNKYIGHSDVEYQIICVGFSGDKIKQALSLQAGINIHHSKGNGSEADGIESLFWNNEIHLKTVLDYIDKTLGLNEIKAEVYSSVGLMSAIAEKAGLAIGKN